MIVSIDTETLGLNSKCDLIEFGAVIDNGNDLKDLPSFHCYVTKANGIYQGEPYAMSMHATILRRIANREEGYSYIPSDCLDVAFHEWLCETIEDYPEEKITIAGKNFANFDLRFLELLDFGANTRFYHRILDIGSMYYRKGDDRVPSLEDCLKIAGIEKEIAHDAIEDAFDVIRCIRNQRMQI